MGNPLIGRGVRVEVSKTEGSEKPVTAVTKAKPGVATAAGHGLSDGAVGYFTAVAGMVNIEGQAVRVADAATDGFTLQGVDTTNFPDFTAGKFVPISAWATLSRSTNYQIGGGEAAKLDNTTLLDDIAQEVNGLLAAQTVSFDINHQTTDEEALELITDAALNQEYLVFRITFKDGAQRIFRGAPSIPGENTQQGAIATGSIPVTVKGRILRLPAVS